MDLLAVVNEFTCLLVIATEGSGEVRVEEALRSYRELSRSLCNVGTGTSWMVLGVTTRADQLP